MTVGGVCPGGPLRAFVERLDGEADAIDVAGGHGMVWEQGTTVLAGRGVAQRVEVAPGHRGDLAEATSRALGSLIRLGDPYAPGPVAFGALPFDPEAGAAMVIPAVQLRRGPDGARWLWRVGVEKSEPFLVATTTTDQPERFRVTPDQTHAASRQAVAIAVTRIAAGEVEKVVLARSVTVEADSPFDVAAVLRRLRGAYPTCYLFCVEGFVGASPELLVSRQGDVVRAQPMAGTAPRLGDPVADAQLAARLLASTKNRLEHQYTIDALIEGLLGFCSYLDSEAEPSIVAVANVQHLASYVEGRLSLPLPSVLDLVHGLHPTPAVGGRPRSAALAMQRELEPASRGRYGGPVGWVDAAGNGEFAVGLRCAEINATTARCFGGGGIVGGSEPDVELVETQNKLQAILGALIRP